MTGRKTLESLQWVFEIKRDPERSIKIHKTRLIAKKFTQEYGVNYNEIFLPVIYSI